MDVDKRPTKSLSVLIMGAFSVLFLALLGIVAATILTQKGEIEKRHTALTESLARIAVTNLEHRLTETAQFLEAMAARDSVRALNRKMCDPAFRDYHKSHPNFTAHKASTRIIAASRATRLRNRRTLGPAIRP